MTARPTPDLLQTTEDDLPDGVTAEQFEQYTDLLIDGVSPQDAIGQIWPEPTDAELTERASANGKALGKALAADQRLTDSPTDSNVQLEAENGRLRQQVTDLLDQQVERPAYFVSDVGGVVVGWAMCGGCDKHVKLCGCPAGPTEPAYFEKLRKLDEYNHRRASGIPGSIPAADPVAASESAKVTGKVLAAKANGKGAANGKAGLVPCKVGQHLVEPGQTDRNDDGTYTCFEHQAVAAERTGE